MFKYLSKGFKSIVSFCYRSFSNFDGASKVEKVLSC